MVVLRPRALARPNRRAGRRGGLSRLQGQAAGSGHRRVPCVEGRGPARSRGAGRPWKASCGAGPRVAAVELGPRVAAACRGGAERSRLQPLGGGLGGGCEAGRPQWARPPSQPCGERPRAVTGRGGCRSRPPGEAESWPRDGGLWSWPRVGQETGAAAAGGEASCDDKGRLGPLQGGLSPRTTLGGG